jgi:uncharacterized protein YndB with AHSA1/START domain
MAEIRIVRDYPQPPPTVWRALTDPTLIPRWTTTGAGGRPEGFATTVGAKFRYVAKPRLGWSGIVECEVLESDEPTMLRYSWADPGGGEVTEVAYRLEARGNGTRFTFEHTGFSGIGGLFMATLLGRVRAKMLTIGLPAVLETMN